MNMNASHEEEVLNSEKLEYFETLRLLTEYSESNFATYLALRAEYKKNNIIPFIGSGITVEIVDASGKPYYPSWKAFLEQLEERIFLNNDEKDSFHKYMTLGKYYDAAQILCDKEKIRFINEVRNIYGHKIDTNYNYLNGKTIKLIAEMFQNKLSITVNFDSAVKDAYRLFNVESYSILSDSDSVNRVASVRANAGKHVYLAYLHGMASDRNSDIIFTKKQVEEHYKENQKLYLYLNGSVVENQLLFLGVGLKDEYVDILSSCLNGLFENYTIINSDDDTPESIDKKKKELEEKKITPIIYMKDRHEYVRKILQMLKADFSCSADELRYYIETKIKKSSFANRNSEENSWFVDYIDINDNKQRLNQFLDNDEPVLTCNIIGKKWTGKTKLANEIEKTAKIKGFSVELYNDTTYKKILISPSYRNHRKYVLYIFDNAHLYSVDILSRFRNFIEEMINDCHGGVRNKLRVIMIYNPDKILPQNSWINNEELNKVFKQIYIEGNDIVLPLKNEYLFTTILHAGLNKLSSLMNNLKNNLSPCWVNDAQCKKIVSSIYNLFSQNNELYVSPKMAMALITCLHEVVMQANSPNDNELMKIVDRALNDILGSVSVTDIAIKSLFFQIIKTILFYDKTVDEKIQSPNKLTGIVELNDGITKVQ